MMKCFYFDIHYWPFFGSIFNKITYWEVVNATNRTNNKSISISKLLKKIKAYGQLVLLDFSVTTFTSVAYQRHSL